MCLLPRRADTAAERFAIWIDIRRETRGLDAAVLDDLPGIAIRTHVLTLGSVAAEGLHPRGCSGRA
jgi:hypothetical protein